MRGIIVAAGMLGAAGAWGWATADNQPAQPQAARQSMALSQQMIDLPPPKVETARKPQGLLHLKKRKYKAARAGARGSQVAPPR